jgi:elongation factor 2 kinase
MDAKLWGEEFNRHNPPKKVDIFMMCVYEFHEREDKPLFHVEHFIDGDYIKYNSNSGFVDGKFCRQVRKLPFRQQCCQNQKYQFG